MVMYLCVKSPLIEKYYFNQNDSYTLFALSGRHYLSDKLDVGKHINDKNSYRSLITTNIWQNQSFPPHRGHLRVEDTELLSVGFCLLIGSSEFRWWFPVASEFQSCCLIP